MRGVLQNPVGTEVRDERKSYAGVVSLVSVFAVTAFALLAIFRGAEWYADNVSIPRYCENPDGSMRMLKQVLSDARPAGNGPTRPYIVVAKLIQLVPQRAGEAMPAYLVRVRTEIDRRCT